MRLERGDDHDFRQLVERGSAGWSGPSPTADRSRWAAVAARGRRGAAARLVVGLGFAAVALGAVAIFVAGQPANGPAASVMRLVSHVLPAPPATPTLRPAPSSPPASPAPPAGAGAAGVTPAAPARSTPRPSPTPARSGGDDGHRPSASPSPRPTDE
jgi:hypothetical protein